MFKRLVNECTIDLWLRPQGALLIKSGLEQVSDVKMAWVKVYRGGNSEPEVYLPGSSLKGTIRSHAERIARTLKSHAACDPFEDKGSERRTRSCSAALQDKKNEMKKELQKQAANRQNHVEEEVELRTDYVYGHSCPVCRLFGNTWLLGRFATEDAYLDLEKDKTEGKENVPPQIQIRDCVGIDRFTGGSARTAKFDMEVITGGVFKTTLHLQNFELWQLGLLGFVLQDMKDGLVRLGSGKSRGLGKVVAEVGKITLHYLGASQKVPEDGQLNVMGVGALFDQAGNYGMTLNDRVQTESSKAEILSSPFAALRQSFAFSYENFPWQSLAKCWENFTKSYQDGLATYRGGRDASRK